MIGRAVKSASHLRPHANVPGHRGKRGSVAVRPMIRADRFDVLDLGPCHWPILAGASGSLDCSCLPSTIGPGAGSYDAPGPFLTVHDRRERQAAVASLVACRRMHPAS